MFLIETPDWADRGAAILDAVLQRAATVGLAPADLGLVLVRAGADGRPEGFTHRGDWRAYPCSLVKAFHLVHALSALERGLIADHPELDRAIADMILWSSNTATNYVIDAVTGTTGDTLLDPAAMAVWVARRAALNRFFQALDWPEFAGCNISQKLMDDVRYGRQAEFAGPSGENLNVLTPLAAARLMWELFEGRLPLSAPARARAQMTLWRDRAAPEALRPDYQVAGYLGGGLPAEVELHSKAGHNLWTGDPKSSWYKHDMLRIAAPGRAPLIVVLMTRGRAVAEADPTLFPDLGRLIWDMAAGASAGPRLARVARAG